MGNKGKHIPEIEKRPQAEIKAFQDEKLKEMLAYISKSSRYYAEVFNNFGVNINKINGIEDLPILPVTTKDELHRYNDDFICVPRTKVIDLITTSGTMGDPVTFAMTDKDLDRLAYNEYLSLSCAGADEKDTFLLLALET